MFEDHPLSLRANALQRPAFRGMQGKGEAISCFGFGETIPGLYGIASADFVNLAMT